MRIALAVPAIVDHEILVARIAHAARDQGVSGIADQLFVDIAGKRFQLFQPIGGVKASPASIAGFTWTGPCAGTV